MKMETKTFQWNNQIGHRSRRAWLLLVDPRTDRMYVFEGKNIPGVIAITGTDYEKAGKWSHTTFRLESPAHIRHIAGHDGWETDKFTEGLKATTDFPRPIDRWIDVADALGVTLPEVQRFLREWRPREADRLDEVEAALGDMVEAEDELGNDTEIIVINFGSPTNRQIRDGFWDWPVIVSMGDDEIARLTRDPETGQYITQGRVEIISQTHSSGYHGGYISLRLAVPAGAVARHERPE